MKSPSHLITINKRLGAFGLPFLMIGLAYLIVNAVLGPPQFRNSREKIVYGESNHLPALAAEGYLEELKKDSLNPNLLRAYLCAASKYAPKGDSSLFWHFEKYTKTRNFPIRDAGYFALGVLANQQEKPLNAIFNFSRVKDQNLAQLHVCKGLTQLKLEQYKKVAMSIKDELANPRGVRDSAYSLWVKMEIQQKNWETLAKLWKQEKFRPYFNPATLRRMAFQTGDSKTYFRSLSLMMQKAISFTGLTAAIFVMLIWLTYLLMLHIFEAGSKRYVVLSLALGMLASFGTFILSDYIHLSLGYQMTGGLQNDFAYSVLAIGAVEELVKIIPLLLIVLLSKIIKEPYGYILHASVAALGFALIENTLYYSSQSLHIIHARAMTAVVGHMFHSSLIAYGLVLSLYRYKKWPPWLAVLGFFVIASLSHGLYNFLIFNKLYILLAVLFMLMIHFWINMINDALNNSPYFNPEQKLHTWWLMFYLIVALTAVLIYEYAAFGWTFGPEAANQGLLKAGLRGSFLILILAVMLSRFELVNHQWQMFSLRNFLSFYKVLIPESHTERTAKYYGKHFRLKTYRKTSLFGELIGEQRIRGKVTSSALLFMSQRQTTDRSWFVFELEEELELKSQKISCLLIKFKPMPKGRVEGEAVPTFVLAVTDKELLKEPVLSRASFQYLGLGMGVEFNG